MVRDLDELPFPAYDLLSIDKYYSPQTSQKPFVSMMTSRGCPYRCIFCDAHAVFERKYRFQSPERTVEEIKYLVKDFKIRELLIKDSEFTINKERVYKLCELLSKNKLNVRWSCNVRVDSLDEKLVQAMKNAGCRLMQFGVESGDQAILDKLKKRITIDEIRRAFKLAHAAGIRTQANFMFGHPGETREAAFKTIEMGKNLNPDYAAFNFMIPFPGTELYSQATENNWFLDGSDPWDFRIDKCVMNASEMSTEELEQMQKLAYRSFYFRPAYMMKRFLTVSAHEWKMNLKGVSKILKL